MIPLSNLTVDSTCLARTLLDMDGKMTAATTTTTEKRNAFMVTSQLSVIWSLWD
jgi:hypothetical protein